MKANFWGKNQKDMSDNGTHYAKIQHSKIKASFVQWGMVNIVNILSTTQSGRKTYISFNA